MDIVDAFSSPTLRSARAKGNLWRPKRVHPLPDRAARLHSVRGFFMNNIIYLVGLVVVVLAILSFLGLR